ncbi:hypothetical protein MPC4_270034 [Methylocella tundrae]|uniref:Transposase n=1 Tax=Methylocella tundrae TaxID=227605 RepID=A0A8B6M6J8_METTU|nr:hypothetical protein MPC4_270034 [Methylocella tundrae]
MRWIVGGKTASRCAASASQMGRFETLWLTDEKNLGVLADLSGQWIDRVHGRRSPKGVVLDMESSVSPADSIDRRNARLGDCDGCIGKDVQIELIERTTRFTILLHLPRMEGHGDIARVKNGPALAGHSAEAVRDAIAATITRLPEQLRRLLTSDQGASIKRSRPRAIHRTRVDSPIPRSCATSRCVRPLVRTRRTASSSNSRVKRFCSGIELCRASGFHAAG